MENGFDREKLANLAKLARINLDENNGEKLLHDTEKILAYFEELDRVDTENIEPMIGGTEIVNTAREDERSEEIVGDGIESFPRSRDGYLEVPAVMKDINSDL